MLEQTRNPSITQYKLQYKNTQPLYLECYGAVRRNISMKREGCLDEDIEAHWQACLIIYGPELLWLCWRHWFALRVAHYTGIGDWHGWHNAIRLHRWDEAMPYWFTVIFPIPF
jgi:hypothetical protein